MKTITRLIILLGLLLTVPSLFIFSQVGINTDNSPPDNSAILDLKSTNKGFLLPRLSKSQILAISNPANGLIVFCTTDNKFYAYVTNTDTWKEIPFGSGTLFLYAVIH